MRVLNDKVKRDESSELGILAVISQSFLCALGISTVLMGPLPMIHAHVRMSEPWPKVTALLGAIVAMLFLDVPLFPIVVSFVVGLYLANGACQRIPLFRLMLGALAVGFGVGAVGWVGASYLHHVSMGNYWHTLVEDLLSLLQTNFKGSFSVVDSDVKWESIRKILYYQGPFFYLSAVMISCWLSLGLSAHVGWWNEKHPYSANGLRSIEPSKLISFIFSVFFLGDLFVDSPAGYIWGGMLRLITMFVFIQGCIALSRLMYLKGLRPFTRAIIYALFIAIGFYALVGIGWAYPFFSKSFKKKRKVAMPLRPSPLEEVL
jgi:hypothetical protein